MVEIQKKQYEAYGYSTKDGKIVYYGDLAAREAIKAGTQLVSVPELPTASVDTMGKIYLVPASRTGIDKNVKAEYVTIKGGTADAPTYSWEKIGDTDLDLSGYSKVGHTHKVTSNVEVADAEYTPEGANEASEVTFATEGHTANVITGIGDSTVPAYKLGDETKQKISATASGVDVNVEEKLVVASEENVGSVVAGSDAELSEGAQAAFDVTVDENGIMSFNFTANTLQTLTGGKATQVTLPTFAKQNIATSIKSQPTVALALGETGDVDVVTAQGALSTDGTNAVTFGELSKEEAILKGVTATAAAQAFTGTKATLHHEVTNNEVTSSADIAPQA